MLETFKHMFVEHQSPWKPVWKYCYSCMCMSSEIITEFELYLSFHICNIAMVMPSSVLVS